MKVGVAGVLMVGGYSRRMGRDKASLEVDGIAFWRRQLEVLRKLGLERLVVSARKRPEWLPQDVMCVCDRETGVGPLGGVVSVLEEVKCSHVLVLAVDIPQMTFDFLKKMLLRREMGRGVVPKVEGQLQPLVAVYPVEGLRLAKECLAAKRYSMMAWIDRLEAEGRLTLMETSEADWRLFHNVNRPEDISEKNRF